MTIFATVQYCIYANIAGGSEISPKICGRNIGMVPLDDLSFNFSGFNPIKLT